MRLGSHNFLFGSDAKQLDGGFIATREATVFQCHQCVARLLKQRAKVGFLASDSLFLLPPLCDVSCDGQHFDNPVFGFVFPNRCSVLFHPMALPLEVNNLEYLINRLTAEDGCHAILKAFVVFGRYQFKHIHPAYLLQRFGFDDV